MPANSNNYTEPIWNLLKQGKSKCMGKFLYGIQILVSVNLSP